MDTVNVICPGCGESHLVIRHRDIQTGEMVIAFGQTSCSACSDAENLESKRLEDEAKANEGREKLEREWQKLSLPLYERTDLSRLPGNLRSIAETWTPSEEVPGLALVGSTGKWKTRTAYSVARRLHFAGNDVVLTSGISLANAASAVFSHDDDTAEEAAKLLSSAKESDVLFIDEVGKEKITERVATSLFEIIEHRNARLQSTIWTSNLGPTDLIAAMGERGEPLVRRLKEFSKIISV